MKLFPHILVRISGEPFAELEALRLCGASRIADEIHTLQATMATHKHELSDALYGVIGAQTDTETRVALINLRRDIFNEREIAADAFDALGPHLPAALYTEIRRYRHRQQQLNARRREGESVYARDLIQSRRRLRDLVQTETLQKGLILSSQSLLKYGIPSYLNGDLETLNRQDRKTEQSLIKYLSRIHAKTSPFSTFTHLALGCLAPGESNGAGSHSNPFALVAEPENSEVVSHIRLNNYLYKYLKDLLTHNPAVYREFPLRPNPTLTREGDQFLFLTNSNNVESFQRVPFSPVLELFQRLAAERREGVRYRDLVQTILDQEYIDTSWEELEAYINQLIEYGFLEFNIGVSGIDPDWDLALRETLRPLCQQQPLLAELGQTLQQMRAFAQRYAEADVDTRRHILEEAFTQFKTICMQLHEAAGLPAEERLSPEERKAQQARRNHENSAEEAEDATKDESAEPEEVFQHRTATHFAFRPEQIFYEDTVLDASLRIDATAMATLTAPLARLLPALALFEGQHDERDRMRHHFVQTYGSDASINLLTFYEDYYRQVKKPAAVQRRERQRAQRTPHAQQQNENGAPQNAPDTDAEDDVQRSEAATVPAIQTRRERRQAWLQQLAATVQESASDSADRVHLCFEHIQQTNEHIEGTDDAAAPLGSYGAFIQCFPARDETGRPCVMGVLNGAFPGYGKMMSRFLHLFDATITQELRAWNRSLARDARLVEDCDASYFNANLHPPLLPFEIWMPGGHNGLPAQQQIAVTELDVCLDDQAQQLQLIHRTSGTRCYVFDLGFQGHLGRSQLFQLLHRFTGAQYLSVHPIRKGVANSRRPAETAETEEQSKPEAMRIRPRIIYEDRLILQRKAWLIPKALHPTRQPAESDWAYFARLNAWRLEHGMPTEVFLRLFEPGTLPNLQPAARRKLSRDDHKPQYICFHDPFLVMLFEKLLEKAPDTLIIEEMLPNSEQLLMVNQQRRVTEFVIQWYTGEEERGAAYNKSIN